MAGYRVRSHDTELRPQPWINRVSSVFRSALVQTSPIRPVNPRHTPLIGAGLGSRLIQVHHMTTAASATAEA